MLQHLKFFVFLIAAFVPQLAFSMNAFECGMGRYMGFMQIAFPCYLIAQASLSFLLFFFLLKKKERFKKAPIIFLRIVYLFLGLFSLAAFLFFLWGEPAAQALPSLLPVLFFPVVLIFRFSWLLLLLLTALYVAAPLSLHEKGFLKDREIQIFGIALGLFTLAFIVASGFAFSHACIEPDGKGM